MPADLSPADRELIERVLGGPTERFGAYTLGNNALARLLSAARADGPGGGYEPAADVQITRLGGVVTLQEAIEEDINEAHLHGEHTITLELHEAYMLLHDLRSGANATGDVAALSPVMVEGGLGTSSANGAATREPISRAAGEAEQAGWRPTHRHVKRGTDYEVIGEGSLQWSTHAIPADYTPVTIYRGADGELWVRSTHQFNDGRFEPIPAPPASVISPPTAADAMSAPDTKPQSPQTGEEAER